MINITVQASYVQKTQKRSEADFTVSKIDMIANIFKTTVLFPLQGLTNISAEDKCHNVFGNIGYHINFLHGLVDLVFFFHLV